MMRTCEGCGRGYEQLTAKAERRWCSRRCGSLTRKRAHREQIRATTALVKAAPRVVTRTCDLCGATYEPISAARSRYCSADCVAEARAAEKRAVRAAERVARQQVTEERVRRLAELEARLRTPVADRRRMQSLLLAPPLLDGQRCGRCRGNLIVQSDDRLTLEVVCLACGERPTTLPPALERLFSRLAGLVA